MVTTTPPIKARNCSSSRTSAVTFHTAERLPGETRGPTPRPASKIYIYIPVDRGRPSRSLRQRRCSKTRCRATSCSRADCSIPRPAAVPWPQGTAAEPAVVPVHSQPAGKPSQGTPGARKGQLRGGGSPGTARPQRWGNAGTV